MKLLRDFNENRNCFSDIPLLLLLYVGTHYCSPMYLSAGEGWRTNMQHFIFCI